MTRVRKDALRLSFSTAVRAVAATFLFVASFAHAQLFSFPKQELVDYTAKSPFERLPDGRPKIPDAMISRA